MLSRRHFVEKDFIEQYNDLGAVRYFLELLIKIYIHQVHLN